MCLLLPRPPEVAFNRVTLGDLGPRDRGQGLRENHSPTVPSWPSVSRKTWEKSDCGGWGVGLVGVVAGLRSAFLSKELTSILTSFKMSKATVCLCDQDIKA